MRPDGIGLSETSLTRARPTVSSLTVTRLGALAILLAAGCSGTTAPGRVAAEPMVRVVHPLVRPVTDYRFATGRTEARESVELQSRVTGYLQSIDFTPGDVVPAQKQLFKIDPRPYEAAYNIALAQVQLAQARSKLAEADFARAQELLRTPGVISQAEVDKYIAAQTEAAAQVAAADANARAARLDVDFTSIVAPIAGVVGRNLPNVGDLIKKDDTLLSTVVSEDPMFAYFEVDELTMLSVGRLINDGKIQSRATGAVIPVEMALADEGEDYPHKGTMDFINNRTSATTGTLEVRAVFENPLLGDGVTRMFKPGMFVRIRVPIGQPTESVLVPQAAIGTDQGRKYVLTVNAENVVEEHVVELGPVQPEGLQVIRPVADGSTADPSAMVLSPNDRVIIGGLQLVRPGTKVTVREKKE
jgi:multidrug efflux system membrane fusion protein